MKSFDYGRLYLTSMAMMILVVVIGPCIYPPHRSCLHRERKLWKMPICACGNRDLAIVTSWSDLNPRRRFWSCLRNERRCGWIGWFDEPMCPRSVEVMPGLIRSMNKLQESLQQATLQARMYKLFILFSWGLFAIHYLK
ncbi:unnamed protein product [Lactuca saligna]|uniref:GRF-type domain-containing protein n=1 Tax=Lactuca saligna TaxID=75948 RepID=A0AA35YSF3_LACSI|nr:unnamed protein product [Lactuca saligna]